MPVSEFDTKLLTAPAPSLSSATDASSVLLSEQHALELRELLAGYCQRTLEKSGLPQLAADNAFASLREEKMRHLPVCRSGKSEVISLRYIDANEGSQDGCMLVLDRFTCARCYVVLDLPLISDWWRSAR